MVRGKPSNKKTLRAIGLGDAFLDQADDDVIADQPTRIHDLLGLQTQRRAGLDCSAEHVTRGDLGNVEVLADEGGLGAFARARRAQQNQSHG